MARGPISWGHVRAIGDHESGLSEAERKERDGAQFGQGWWVAKEVQTIVDAAEARLSKPRPAAAATVVRGRKRAKPGDALWWLPRAVSLVEADPGITNRELARRLETSPSTLSRSEKAKKALAALRANFAEARLGRQGTQELRDDDSRLVDSWTDDDAEANE
ncbi:MAG: winged helix-turn-helix transcriptional regulator [Planctomycetaceae bacterium]|nr:winged helix-turn-helix transcriptional regulator [Planctomycetaceae bacterium]